MSLLNVRNLTVRFGGLTAVNDISFEVRKGEIVSLIGPNGAGKTTAFNAITGLVEPTSGTVELHGAPLLRPTTVRSLVQHLTFGFVAAVLLLIAVNAEDLFQQAILNHYVYRQQFNVAAAYESTVAALAQADLRLTLLPLLIGVLVGTTGSLSVWRAGRRSPDAIVARGIARTFQNIRLFQNMSVLENVMLGAERHQRSGFLAAVLALPRARRELQALERRGRELLTFVGLQDTANTRAGNLAYGLQRRLEIARALASEPELLLLDEPAAGMNPTESAELLQLIRNIRERGVAVLLIEHDMKVVMNISDRIVVLDYGNKIAEGAPAAIKTNSAVIEAYLGRHHEQ